MSAISFLNETINGAAGSAQGRVGTTITTFSISLAAGFILFAVQFGTFLIIRNYLWAKRIYQPRSFLVPVKQRIKPPHNNPFKWLFTVFTIREDPEVLAKAGMDAYFFLRYLSMCLKIFTPMAVIIMPILIPLNVKQGKGTNTISGVTYNVTGLDTLAWSNVSPANTSRYWAHLILAVGVVAWACFMFHQELSHYIAKREEFISSLGHRLKASSTTVLIQDIPENLCNEEALEELYGDFPGGIRRIWINRDFTKLVNKDKLRKYYENLLENTETDLLRKVVKQSRKAKSHQRGESTSTQETPEQAAPDVPTEEGYSYPARPEIGSPSPAACQLDLEYDLETKAAWTRFLTPKQRKTMRIPKDGHTAAAKIPLIGHFFSTKVDTIYYCRRELARLNVEFEVDVKTPEAHPQNLSAFVQFNSQKAAHLACQSVAGTTPSHMRRRLVEISPGDINWPSLNLSWRARYLRLLKPILACSLPPPCGQEGERSLQLWYFISFIFELFIIPTISSGLTSIVEELIRTPTSVPNILATNLPTAANYYFSFLILQALSLSATSILQTIRLFKFYVIGHVNTPDSVFEKLSWTNLTRIGSNIPWYTTFAVIGLVYSTIAPLMLLFMLITFSLFWVVIKNNLLYCVRTGTVDGGGLFFPSAINQLFTGLYFMEFCLIGLFFLVRDTRDKVACAAQGIVIAVVLVFTILYQIWLMGHLSPLFKYAPVQLEVESKALLADYEEKLRTGRPGTQETSEAANSDPLDEDKVPLDLSSQTAFDTQNTETAHRPPFAQRHSSHRSQDIQLQQREDAKSAERILARVNRPLNEVRLAQLEKKLVARTEAGIGSVLLPRRKDIEAQMLDDPISKIIMQQNDELENLDPEERDMLTSVAFMHPVLRETRPCVWIPGDESGVSDDEVRRTRELSGDLVVDNRGAYFDRRLKVQVDKPPPDMSEFALIMAEL
ncbi:uncharacterized protein PAC_09268 [Phialocephala subalpina]|uniref:DUF221-domain-containing protein n=1 Tax=Phialocephala subalpina TaxID=576137 RepID=A0A1L7X305_9HELO|nr:uncharacterized protein PAC_09268 [Phialocephala subalpina]